MCVCVCVCASLLFLLLFFVFVLWVFKIIIVVLCGVLLCVFGWVFLHYVLDLYSRTSTQV